MFLSLRVLRAAAISGFFATAACLPACSSDKTSNENNSLGSDIIREGTTTTAALNEFLAGTADDWGWAGGQFDTPSDQAALPPVPAETFAWHADPTDPPAAGDTIDPNKQQGQAFMLVFKSPAKAMILRVFTSLTTYTPDAAAWKKLSGYSEQLTVNVSSATFENDLLTSDGGPHIGQSIAFVIDPAE